MSGIRLDDASQRVQFLVTLSNTLLSALDETTSQKFGAGYMKSLLGQIRNELNKTEPKEYGKLFAAVSRPDTNRLFIDALLKYIQTLEAGGDPTGDRAALKEASFKWYRMNWDRKWEALSPFMKSIPNTARKLLDRPADFDPKKLHKIRELIEEYAPAETQTLFASKKDDQYWVNLVNKQEENAKTRFMSSPEMKQIAQDNGWTMEQAWEETGRDFANALFDPRNRLVATDKQATYANKPNAEAFNMFDGARANMNYLVTSEHFRNLSGDLQSRLRAISEEMEALSQEWDANAGTPPEASPYEEPIREDQHVEEHTASRSKLLD
ncbi:Uncharacterised protein [uncultured archaeon]|nr:Uncharacterised protein [uncultured archaeon]